MGSYANLLAINTPSDCILTMNSAGRNRPIIPQLAETNTPHPMDLAGQGSLYDDLYLRIFDGNQTHAALSPWSAST
jgi:hypothetical protein